MPEYPSLAAEPSCFASNPDTVIENPAPQVKSLARPFLSGCRTLWLGQQCSDIQQLLLRDDLDGEGNFEYPRQPVLAINYTVALSIDGAGNPRDASRVEHRPVNGNVLIIEQCGQCLEYTLDQVAGSA